MYTPSPLDLRGLTRLQQSSDVPAARLVAQSRAEAVKRSARSHPLAPARATSQVLRNRAAISKVVPDMPHVTLTDEWWDYSDRFVMRTDYDDPWSAAVREDREGIMRAGGYRVQEVWERALRSAVAGLEIAPLHLSQQPPDVTMTAA